MELFYVGDCRVLYAILFPAFLGGSDLSMVKRLQPVLCHVDESLCHERELVQT